MKPRDTKELSVDDTASTERFVEAGKPQRDTTDVSWDGNVFNDTAPPERSPKTQDEVILPSMRSRPPPTEIEEEKIQGLSFVTVLAGLSAFLIPIVAGLWMVLYLADLLPS